MTSSAPDALDPDGLTPLMRAAGLGDAAAVRQLLAAGADVNALEPRMGASALHKAAQAGSSDGAALLLDAGAFIDLQSPVIGHTALMDAVLHRHAPLVALLLARGARTTPRNHFQQTALELARAAGLVDIAHLIEACDVRNAVRVRGQRLPAAARAGDAIEVARLLAAGAAVDQRSCKTGSADDDYTPLGLAAREGHVAPVRLLLSAGADLRLLNGLMGATAAHEAAYAGHAAVLEILVAHGALALDAQGAYNGMTALHDAVWQGHPAAVRVLLEAGARRDPRSHTGQTARELAVQYGHDDIVRLFDASCGR